MDASTKQSELFAESNRLAGKWMNDYNSLMMEVYSKQLKGVTNFYNNIFQMFSPENMENGKSAAAMSGWMNLNRDMMKNFFSPLEHFSANGNSINSFASSYTKIFSQMAQMNLELFNSMSKQLNRDNTGSAEVFRQFNKALEDQLELTRKIVNTTTDALKKRLELGEKITNEAVDLMNRQTNTLIQQNQNYWQEMLRNFQASHKEGGKKSEEKTQKEKERESVMVH